MVGLEPTWPLTGPLYLKVHWPPWTLLVIEGIIVTNTTNVPQFLLHRFICLVKTYSSGAPGWLSGGASAFGSGHDPGVPGSSPTSGSLAGSLLLPLPVSLPLSVCLF